ncbi:helix-hairpin-helix domain-containing protein [Bifidobacteriaceae bacterium NR002]|nr:helix-hairpin-helix domain-containing protein [Bifidobacteriaceae bacterium NR002]MDZ7549484.1 helix-hairpin-helix domain-containing protein [Bifidobacteriaceae bacterium NR047]
MEYYEPGSKVPEPKTDLPHRRIASSLSEFSNDAFSENNIENNIKNNFNSFNSALKSSKSSARFHMKPIHTLAIMFVLVVALCASLTMLISQSLTYQQMQNNQSELLPKIKNNTNYSKKSFKNLENSTSKESSEGGENSESSESQDSNESQDSGESVENNESNESQESNESRKSSEVIESKESNESNEISKSKSASSKNNNSRINLNTATLTQLQTLKGVGPKTAARIIAQRKRVGSFKSLEDLLQIKGIGPKTLNKFRGIVYVS